MDLIKNLFSAIGDDFSDSTLSGCSDVIVIEDQFQMLQSTLFHVRIGQFITMKKLSVDIGIEINGQVIRNQALLLKNGVLCFIKENTSNLKNEDFIREINTCEEFRQKYLTTLPSNRQLQMMNLTHGKNSLKYLINYPGTDETSEISCEIYYYQSTDKFVFSDFDGTVTQSDVPGLLSEIFGFRWEHQNIAQCYSKIVKNGYNIIYMSARGIGFYSKIKQHVRLTQQNEFKLPEGPALLAPELIFPCLMREVVLHKVDIFKSSIIDQFLSLFNKQNPIFAGFGNRPWDATAYSYGGVPQNKIFNIDKSGLIQQLDDPEKEYSYQKISQEIQEHFPQIV